MTTKELVQWAYNAEGVREESWFKGKNDSEPYGYKLTISQAVEKTMPPIANKREKEMVVILLYQAWNEVQDWYMME